MLKTVLTTVLFCALLAGAGTTSPPAFPAAHAAEDWRAEFDDICAKTLDPMSLSKEELKTLIERCDKLKPRIEGLDASAAKVYLKRLKMCKDLFVFTLEAKSAGQ